LFRKYPKRKFQRKKLYNNKFRIIKEFCNQNKTLLERLNNNLNMFYHEMNTVIRRTNEIANLWGYLYQTSEKYKDDNLSKEIYFQMNNMFFNLAKNFKKQNDFINIDIKESFIFMQNNYGSINELIKRIDSKKKVYFKEEKELISLKEQLFNTRNTPGHQKSNANIEINKKNAEGEFDLSTFLPMNTKALLEMKKSYGFYLNKFLMEYDRMKKLNGVIYREKIHRIINQNGSIFASSSYFKNSNKLNNVTIPYPYLENKSNKLYTLVLDLDETSIHFKPNPNN